MKKILALLLVGILAMAALTGCVGGGGKAIGCEGTYNIVAMQAMGIMMTGEEAQGMSITLDVGGKGTFEAEGDKASAKWTLEGENITITVEGESFKGTLKDNCIEINDFMGMGADCYFALEGSDAENPALYLSENEKEVIGTWKSSEVQDILHDDMSESYDPNGLTFTLNPDHTASFVLDGKEYTVKKWERVLSMGTIEETFTKDDGTEFEIDFDLEDDGRMEVSYSDDEENLYYYCTK